MKKDKHFNEVQRFNHPLFIAFMGIITIYILSKWFNIFYGSVTEERAISLWISFCIIMLLNALFFISKIETRIDKKGIHLKFLPFHLKPIFYSWEDIDLAEVIDYKPLKEYGGWGIRNGSSGKAFSTRGNVGIRFTLKDGRKRLIGTQLPDAAQDAINAYVKHQSKIIKEG